MKIAISCSQIDSEGGIKRYVEHILREFSQRDIPTLLLVDSTTEAVENKTLNTDASCLLSTAELPETEIFSRLKEWQPDIFFVQNPTLALSPETLSSIAPLILFSHGYWGLCISGTRANGFWNHTAPCERKFGPKCLALYLPYHCGGHNPVTMFQEYTKQKRVIADLQAHYSAIVASSHHMYREYLRNGFSSDKLFLNPLTRLESTPVQPKKTLTGARKKWRLINVGRMTHLKGGELLIRAIPKIAKGMNLPIELIMVGDGPEKAPLENVAKKVCSHQTGVQVTFTGWLTPNQVREALSETDLLVVPSIWPEPFGLIGLEAAALGIPAVAFDLGGIPEWLKDGFNGHLANATPPTSEALSTSVLRCLQNEFYYQQLTVGALHMATSLSMTTHMDRLLTFFEQTTRYKEPLTPASPSLCQ